MATLANRLFVLELVRRRPARCLRGHPEPLPLGKVIDLDDHAIGVVFEIVPLLRPALHVVDDAVDVVKRLDVRVDGEAIAS